MNFRTLPGLGFLRPLLLWGAALASAHGGPWESLFDGKTLAGWKQLGGAAPYAVVDGAIVGTTIAGTPNSFLATERDFGDFIFECEILQEGGPTNSGVQFRSQSLPTYQNGRVHGYQLEIDPSDRAWSGGIYDEARRGWLYPGTLNPSARSLYQLGRWNHLRIEAIGNSLRTWINGMPVAHVLDGVTPKGFFALQVHSIGRNDEPGKRIHWRNLRVQTTDLAPSPLDPIFARSLLPNEVTAVEKAQGWKPLWDGRTPAGWRGTNGKPFPAAGWTMGGGELAVAAAAAPGMRAGGDIVTEESFGAFELQFEFRLSPGANSGVKYYLAESGTGNALGLEYQLIDDAKHEDAKKGAAGNRRLGSLYDLIPPETVPGSLGIAPKPDVWQHGRIVARADGRVEHWLNGIRVLEYSRGSPLFAALVGRSKFEKNEGFGRAPKGPILLQDHGDAVAFRSLKIRALP
jgi:hypothetical protein